MVYKYGESKIEDRRDGEIRITSYENTELGQEMDANYYKADGKPVYCATEDKPLYPISGYGKVMGYGGSGGGGSSLANDPFLPGMQTAETVGICKGVALFHINCSGYSLEEKDAFLSKMEEKYSNTLSKIREAGYESMFVSTAEETRIEITSLV